MRPIDPKDDGKFNFDKQFRDNLRNMEVTPPAGLWDNLETELNQQQEQVKYNHWYYTSIALLLFFGGFNLVTAFDVEAYYATNNLKKARNNGTYLIAGEHPSQIAGFAYSHYSRINKPLNYTFADNEPLVTVSSYGQSRYITPYIGTTTAKNIYAINEGKYNNTAPSKRFEQASNVLPSLALQAPSNPLSIVYNAVDGYLDAPTPSETLFAKSTVAHNPTDITFSKKPKNALGNIKGLYVGAEYVFTNTRMLQKNSAFYPLLGKEANYMFQRGYQYGVKVGYHFNHRMALELGWIINSAQGQQYSDNLYGKIPIAGSINLSYTQIPLLFKYKFARMSRITKLPVSLNIISGVAYSHLKASTMNINGEQLNDVSDMVSHNELGVIVGLEYGIYMHQNVFLTLGTRGGLYTDTRLFKGLGKDEPRLNNLTLGVSAAIHYQLPKRQPTAKIQY